MRKRKKILVYPSPQWRVVVWWIIFLSFFTGTLTWIIFYLVWSQALEWGVGASATGDLVFLFRKLTGGVIAALLGTLAIGAGMGTIVGLVVTHKFAGPLYRLRGVIQEALQGGEIREITLRRGDELQDLVEDFNKLLRELREKGEKLKRVEEEITSWREKKKLPPEIEEIHNILKGGRENEKKT